MLRKMPLVLLGLMVLLGLTHTWIPEGVQSVFYAFSLTIKSLIIFVLPFIIFGLLFKTAVGFARTASQMILFVLAAIFISNFFSTMLSFCVGKVAYGCDLTMNLPSEGAALQAAWLFELPKWIGNDIAMLSGLILGVVLGRWKATLATQLSVWFERAINLILKGFLYVIPLFITGFFIKMYHDQVMGYIIQNYGVIFALTASSIYAYVLLLFYLGTRNEKVSFVQSIKNMLPAMITGFGSMSSAAAMPMTLLGTEKNAKNPQLACSIIPATVNIHLIGDCIAIPVFVFAVMKSFGMMQPDLMQYFIFALYFVLAKFSVAAVPGGGVLVMLPIIESHFGFNADMLSLVTALYILFDPIITAANVLGNGGFAIGLSKLFGRRGQKSVVAVAERE
jgi:Na+/H+-dicarboxylate symporter